MQLGDVLRGAQIECPKEYENIEINRIVSDSREVSEGCMFIAIRGNNTDGHKFIEQAIKNGAVVIVAEQVRGECVGGAAIILVDDTRRAAALLYNSAYDFPSKRLGIIGVTGTNGKTSVCFMLKSIFEAAGISCGVIGTTGAKISGSDEELYTSGLTTPDAATLYPLLCEMADRGVKYVFMEVSSHAIAAGRVAALDFELGIFTNLSRDHLDFHGSMQSYFEVKASMFARCRKKIVNIDNSYGAYLSRLYGEAKTCSTVRAGDYCAQNVEINKNGSSYTLSYRCGCERIELGALGDFSVINSLEAAAAALEIGLPISAVKVGLARFFGATGRMQRVWNGDFDVFIDYAHTPDALENVLHGAKRFCSENGRVIVVFGCGGDRDKGKRKEMAHVASRLAHLCVVTSDNPRSEDAGEIIADILKGIDKERPHAVIPSRAEAIRYAVLEARRGDVVIIAGKGHEKYQIDKNGTHLFDEQAIVLAALECRVKNENDQTKID